MLLYNFSSFLSWLSFSECHSRLLTDCLCLILLPSYVGFDFQVTAPLCFQSDSECQYLNLSNKKKSFFQLFVIVTILQQWDLGTGALMFNSNLTLYIFYRKTCLVSSVAIS